MNIYNESSDQYESGRVPVCQINVARWGLPLFAVSPPPPQHDMVTTDNDVSSGRYGVNLNQDSNLASCDVSSCRIFLISDRYSLIPLPNNSVEVWQHRTNTRQQWNATHILELLLVDHHHISVQLGSIERIKGIQFISDGK